MANFTMCSCLLAALLAMTYAVDKCIMREERFLYPPLYTMASKPLPSVAIAFILIPIVKFDDCFVDVADIVNVYNFDKSKSAFAAFSFVCILPIHVEFRCSNESLCDHGDHVIGNLEIMTCKMSLETVNSFSEYFHIISIYLYEMELTTNNLNTGNIPEPEAEPEGKGCVGLKNLDTVVVALMPNLTYTDFLNIFQCYTVFEKVSTLVISDIPWETITDDLIKVFPNLQSLELQNIGMTHPPIFYPWSNSSLSLPLNLSRTEYLQNLYASSLYLEIPTSKPRRVFNLRYNTITNMSEYRFTGEIQMITLENNDIVDVNYHLIADVKGLQNLNLAGNKLEQIPQGLFDGQINLRSLTLRQNQIQKISPNLFQDLQQLIYLDISNNELGVVHNGTFESLLSLKELHLENNRIHFIGHNAFPIISKQIESIYLDKNPLTDMPISIFYISSLLKTSLKYTQITFQNFTGLLQTIHRNLLAQNVLAYDPDKKAEQIREVDLTGSRVSNFYIEKDSFDEDAKAILILLLRYFTFILKDNPIRCDCGIAVLSDFVRVLTAKNMFSTQSYMYKDWKCVWPSEFQDRKMMYVEPRETYCSTKDSFKNCPSNCSCYIRYESHILIVDCRNQSYLELPRTLPVNWKLDLWFQHNNISHVEPRGFFKQVRQFRISDNDLRKLDESAIRQMTHVKEIWLDSNHLSYIPHKVKRLLLMTMKLKNNPYVCDCHNLWFKQWIEENKKIIIDWEEITCGSESESGKRLVDGTDDDFVCTTQLDFTVEIVVAASGSVFLMVVIILVMVYKFEIQVLLYVWFGIHPCDRMKEKGSENIDIIIIHNLDVTDWVHDNILGFLESTCRLRVCEIDRDFIAGYSFHENISYLAAQSKRMLIVLSPTVLTYEGLVRMSLNESHHKVRDSRLNFYIFVCHQISCSQIRNKYIRKQMKRSKVIQSNSKLFLEKLLYLMPRKRNIEDLKIHIELESLSMSFTHQNTKSTVFDIFILYGEHYHIVFKELVPRLESTGYTLCLPDREFVPGSSKQANVLAAIKNSRHTLIVLTEENMSDEWLVFGFRSAMEKNLHGKFNHLVVLTDNKIDINDLHAEMRHYINSHVILYLDDNSIWEKIYRSMPLKTRCKW